MTMPQFDERWNLVNESFNGYWNIFPFICCYTLINIFIAFFIVLNHIHALRIMWLPVVGVQYDDAYGLIDPIKITSKNWKKKFHCICVCITFRVMLEAICSINTDWWWRGCCINEVARLTAWVICIFIGNVLKAEDIPAFFLVWYGIVSFQYWR